MQVESSVESFMEGDMGELTCLQFVILVFMIKSTIYFCWDKSKLEEVG